MPRVHFLKTWPEYFEAVLDGRKTFEVRQDDRGFRVGDFLVLEEWSPEYQSYSGRSVRVRVTYILDHGPISAGDHIVTMSIVKEAP